MNCNNQIFFLHHIGIHIIIINYNYRISFIVYFIISFIISFIFQSIKHIPE